MTLAHDLREMRADIPGRDRIAAKLLADEAHVVHDLAERARAPEAEARETDALARRLVEAVRRGRRQTGGIDEFMQEYALSSEEGVVLMCLAEALLRIPDAATADKLIADKIGGRHWERHVGHSESLFVNASAWGLMLTGRVIELGSDTRQDAFGFLSRLTARSGEPFIRNAMRHAMRIMGKQFVLGRTIDEALSVAKPLRAQGYRFSFDMLGEAAMTMADAHRYYDAYVTALETVARQAGKSEQGASAFDRPSISVKLSAIHPRYHVKAKARVMTEMLPRLLRLAELAKKHNLGLTIDAEEMDRLDLQLDVFARLAAAPELAGWDGLGLAVQAYSKRCYSIIEWLADLAAATGRRLPVRLVKGAYWDTEIKRAQESGLAGYPVFTRKVSTDVSYLACARLLLARRDMFYPQFATHNAHTLAAVYTMAGGSDGYEFQRLHGMGQALYSEVLGPDKLARPVRIYAPVGSHEELLAYLVRRLLENGANTSFVNRLADDEAPIDEIVADPVRELEKLEHIPHPNIPLPRDIFRPRVNSRGVALWDDATREPLLADVRAALGQPVRASAIVAGKAEAGEPFAPVTSPQDRGRSVGEVSEASDAQIERALAAADGAFVAWDRRGGAARAEILERAADLYEAHAAKLMSLLIAEAGKTLENALSDLREAVDFLRYYAERARADFAPKRLPGPTGERNELVLAGRGTFVCISPWNFPLAIFTGQMSAALAAGNAVIAKPAEQTPLIAYEAVKLLHQAGVPADVLAYLPGDGARLGKRLLSDRRVSGVAFTGSNETAAIINRSLAEREGAIVPLIAETGGMNAMIVDSSALPEQAVRDLVFSAFDSAGQRCSAARLLFVQDDVADKLIAMLKGAIAELKIGDPLEYATDVGPVIDEDSRGNLEAHKERMRREARTIIDLELAPETRQGSFVAPCAYELDDISALQREVFGPILHVVRYPADRLAQVCEAINATGYGLTLGVHTRIETTVEEVRRLVRVGNLYVNRNQIGAVVGAQPFGGEGLSGTGPKAGGPHYLYRFATERVVSVDTTAMGGNAVLFSLAAEERR